MTLLLPFKEYHSLAFRTPIIWSHMPLDIVLALAALIVAVVGTLKDDFSLRTKRILVGAAAVTCLFAIIKAVSDDHDKTFMKTALISTLVPANSSYVNLVPE